MARNPTSKLIDLDPIIFESSERSISQNPTLEVEEQRSRERREGHTSKWLEWMDQALVCQVLATDPINCARGNTVAKWTEVSAILQKLEPQPVKKSPESCRQRVKKLVEIYKKAELASLKKSGTDEEFGEFELNMVELATRWNQSSVDPTTRRLARLKATQLELDGKRVREASMRGLVRRREEKEESEAAVGSEDLRGKRKKKEKNESVKSIEKILGDFAEGVEEDKKELKEMERKADEKHEDFMYGILELTEEIREQSERRSHDAFLEREARKEELAMILEALRKDNEI